MKTKINFFTRITVTGPLNIILIPSDKTAIEFSIREERYISHSLLLGELTLENLKLSVTPRVYIYYRILKGITANLGCEMVSNSPIQGKELKIVATNESKLDLDVDVERLISTVDGESSLICKGRAEHRVLRIKKGATIDMTKLVSASEKIKVLDEPKVLKSFILNLWIKIIYFKKNPSLCMKELCKQSNSRKSYRRWIMILLFKKLLV